tara:strand:- start:6217 stop:7383 length:1167 start_codon:yes stop_codon:yes gene_type:complete
MKKQISILGSTGSIGLNVLNIIDKKKNIFKANVFSANKNYRLICNQIKKYKPKYFVISNESVFNKIKKKKIKNKTLIIKNYNEINKKFKSDITVSAIPGLAGLEPTMNLIKSSKKILIANKESVICGWDLIKKKANKFKTKIIPIDSEHFSIMQLLKNQNLKMVKKIYITASGGPFLDYKINQLAKIKPKDALKHPKWKMGKKISVDSSTLVNKILELIEAQKIFNIPSNKIDIIIHPESLVHAIVELKNGLLKFLYHETTMKIPLANAIFDNEIDISNFLINSKYKLNNLSFSSVDKKIFPIIKIKKRLVEFPSTPIIINASNEILVDLFLKKKIPFTGISRVLLTILNNRNYRKYAIRKPLNINQINQIDHWARNKTIQIIKSLYE